MLRKVLLRSTPSRPELIRSLYLLKENVLTYKESPKKLNAPEPIPKYSSLSITYSSKPSLLALPKAQEEKLVVVRSNRIQYDSVLLSHHFREEMLKESLTLRLVWLVTIKG